MSFNIFLNGFSPKEACAPEDSTLRHFIIVARKIACEWFYRTSLFVWDTPAAPLWWLINS